MFAPIQAPAFFQTVHGLTYKVMRPSQREENEDPQHTRKSNRIESQEKNKSAEESDDSRFA